MAGTLFGLGLSQQQDATGEPLAGCLLYIYQENSSTPAETYADFTLSTLQTFPIEADSAGRLPQIWVADGSYRARLTTSAGIEVFDEASVTAIGASSTTGGGGGSGSSVDSTTIFQTGDFIWVPVSGTRTGWVRANGRTMGNGASGATERANADTQSLFEHLWNNYTDTICPVSSGRGASAVADFNAAKTIGLVDMRGRTGFGLDTMGNTAASVIVGGSPTLAAFSTGAETATIAQANLPSVNLSSTGLSVVTNFDLFAASGGAGTALDNAQTTSFSATATVTGTIPLGGSGTALNKMPPYRLGSYYIKL